MPGHIVYRNGERVVITDPKDISDPLSDVIAPLADQVDELRERQREWSNVVE